VRDRDVPPAKQALTQKRTVRDLNTRLEMYVRAQAEKTRNINQLKEALARNEMDYRNKLKQQKIHFQEKVEKQRKQIENLEYDKKCTQQELENAMSAKTEYEERLISSEGRNAALASECEQLKTDIGRLSKELEGLRKTYASLKYKYDSYEIERNSFGEKMQKLKSKNEQLLRELTANEQHLKSEKETFQRVIIEKNDELDNLKKQLKELELTHNSTQTRLRQEFDQKLAEFVTNREQQYETEKAEWMRIFKEEFNRKLRSFKEANQELSHANVKQSEEITDLRTRMSKLKQQKTELEVLNRNIEEDAEKLRTDLDNLRRQKDEEIKQKNAVILQQRDAYKAKELQFDELASIKMQLDSEIELYRNILNDAEQECGYTSPLATHGGDKGTRNSRKRKRYNAMIHGTPMGPTPFAENSNNREDGMNTSNSSSNSNNSAALKVETPGITRAAKRAKKEVKQVLQSDGSAVQQSEDEMEEEEQVNEEEMKDKEEDDSEFDEYSTPGNAEGARLQFSGLDLLKGMIEIQNMCEQPISLRGYTLSNDTGTSQFPLPNDVVLDHNQKIRIYCGKQLYQEMCQFDDEDAAPQIDKKKQEIIGDFNGIYVSWGQDVWTGQSNDCARLYNPNHHEIARIEISPDMVDMNASSKSGCFVM